MAKPREVVLWVEKFAAQHDHLHVLVNNAGCMVHERRMDEDGVENNFAVNTLSVHIITTTLAPLLMKSEEARVINVSSAGMLTVRLDPHDLMHLNLEPWNGALVYSQNKRQQVVMTLWYAQRFDKIHFSSMHPGWADTPAVRTSLPQFYEMMKETLRTPTQAADTVVWLAISKTAIKHPGGLFFQDREPVSTHLPLAWTKTTMEEEDLLMKNIHDIFTKVYERAHQNPVSQSPSTTTTTTTSMTREQEASSSDVNTPSNDTHTAHSNSQHMGQMLDESVEHKQEEIVERKPEEVMVKIPPPPAPAPRLQEPPVAVPTTPVVPVVVVPATTNPQEPITQVEDTTTTPTTNVSAKEESETHADIHSTEDSDNTQQQQPSQVTNVVQDNELLSSNVDVVVVVGDVVDSPMKKENEVEVAETHKSSPNKISETSPTTDQPQQTPPALTEEEDQPNASDLLIAPSSSEEKQEQEEIESQEEVESHQPSTDPNSPSAASHSVDSQKEEETTNAPTSS
ncbi:hypothetical protein Pmani_037784 [Petrolisthes manimaculis]|uniref:Dehydrogenase/reductase SDR family member 12 n=1 Tax=Petrolisthes manimaculis TaxID=1843537 RepID=A0AAE1NH09_9EUCA|nr:hypothetical protein Pmani_037784 [Petrolisthes manimaculis]